MTKTALIQNGFAIFGIGDDEESAWNDARQYMDDTRTYEEFMNSDDSDGSDTEYSSLYFDTVPDSVAKYADKNGGDQAMPFLDAYQETEDKNDSYYRLDWLRYLFADITGDSEFMNYENTWFSKIPEDCYDEDEDLIQLPYDVYTQIQSGMSVDDVLKIWNN